MGVATMVHPQFPAKVKHLFERTHLVQALQIATCSPPPQDMIRLASHTLVCKQQN